jgi:tryptophan synthase alpha chain
MKAYERLERAIREPRHRGKPAIMPYITSGFPSMEGTIELLEATGRVADAIEVGVPFSDPMADGPTIQRSSRLALEAGVTLPWILESVKAADVQAPMALMSYLNPLLQYGMERLMRDVADAGISAFIIPDMPFEEGSRWRSAAEDAGLGIIQLVTPVTSAERLRMLCEASRGFVYAVTITGITGAKELPMGLVDYLTTVASCSRGPVCAGFGIRTAADIDRLVGHCDGAVIGSAFIDAVDEGIAPDEFVAGLLGK